MTPAPATTPLPTFPWQEDEVGMLTTDGHVGGDKQAGPSVSRRFWLARPDDTYTVATATYYYTVEYREVGDDGEETGAVSSDVDDFERATKFIDIECQTEFTLCRDRNDVGGTEINSTMDLAYPYDLIPRDEAHAQEIVEQLCGAEGTHLYQHSDGSIA